MMLSCFELLACTKCPKPHSYRLVAERINHDEELDEQKTLKEINEISEGADFTTFPANLQKIVVIDGKLICNERNSYFAIRDGIVMGLEEHRMTEK